MIDDEEGMTIIEKIRWLFRHLGGVLSFMTLVGQILYYQKEEFGSYSLYNSYLAFLLIRPILIILIGFFYIFKNLIRYRVDKDGAYHDRRKDMCVKGLIIYLSKPLMMYFGLYRIFAPKDFSVILFISYFLEFGLQCIPLVFI